MIKTPKLIHLSLLYHGSLLCSCWITKECATSLSSKCLLTEGWALFYILLLFTSWPAHLFFTAKLPWSYLLMAPYSGFFWSSISTFSACLSSLSLSLLIYLTPRPHHSHKSLNLLLSNHNLFYLLIPASSLITILWAHFLCNPYPSFSSLY